MNNTNIFVFGSNLAGRHGKGYALAAKRFHQAKNGIGVGRTGFSYAIPTKDEKLRVLPLTRIAFYVTEFLDYARQHPELNFNIVAIGCGLAGYTPNQIAPLFNGAPSNCNLPKAFRS